MLRHWTSIYSSDWLSLAFLKAGDRRVLASELSGTVKSAQAGVSSCWRSASSVTKPYDPHASSAFYILFIMIGSRVRWKGSDASNLRYGSLNDVRSAAGKSFRGPSGEICYDSLQH